MADVQYQVVRDGDTYIGDPLNYGRAVDFLKSRMDFMKEIGADVYRISNAEYIVYLPVSSGEENRYLKFVFTVEAV
jgi:hypothetical protein